MSFYHLAKESAHLLPKGEKPIKALPLIILSRIIEGGLLALSYFLIYPALQHTFNGTLTLEFILGLTALMLVIFAVRAALFNYSAVKIYEGVFTAGGVLRLRIANHLKTLALGRFQKERLEQVKGILTDDMQVVGQMSGSLLGFFVSAISIPVFIIIGFLFIDWRLAVALSASCLLAYPLVIAMNMFVDRLGAKHFSSISESSMRLVEYVLGIKVLKSYGLTGDRFTYLKDALNHTKQTVLTLEIGAILMIVVSYIIIELGLPIVLLYGTYVLISGGSMDPATFIFALIIAVRFYIPVQEALSMSSEFKYLQKAMDRVRGILTLPSQSVSKNSREPLTEDIIFKDVNFAYEDARHAALHNINLVIPQKTITAFVGPSGAGKTTVANLIARFWDVETGEITIGGVNVMDIKPQVLNDRISMVFQDVILFDDTIFENIRLARSDASEEDVYQAAKDAYCHDFIMAMPEGYQTVIGENGSRLSGGEKQRLSIARALLKNAPIVLLDEATASVDPSSEQQIQKAFARLFENKTVLIIAHKLSTITHADQIVVLNNSQIVQTGTHESLLHEDGLYKTLWENQQQALEWQISKETQNRG